MGNVSKVENPDGGFTIEYDNDQGECIGTGVLSFDPQRDMFVIQLIDVDPSYQGKGHGREIVRQMLSQIPVGSMIYAEVTREDNLMLLQQRYGDLASLVGLAPIDPEDLHSLPMVKLLRSAGVYIANGVLQHNREEDADPDIGYTPYQILLYGHVEGLI